MKTRLLLLSSVLLFLGLNAAAQDGQPTVGVSYWKCDFAHMGDLVGTVDSLITPIAQEFVDAGELLQFGTMTHTWGDEWNLVFYWTAEDIPTFLDVWGKINQTARTRHPGAMNITDYCTDHKDNIYTLVSVTQSPSQM